MVLLMAIFCSSINLLTIPNVNATTQTNHQKTITILEDIVGLNTTEYEITLDLESTNPYLTSVSHIEKDYTLKSSQASLRVRCSFINNNLHHIYLSSYQGVQAFKYAQTNTLDIAKDLMQRYETYTGDSFYGKLNGMLEKTQVKNSTTTTDNIEFEVRVVDNQGFGKEAFVTFRWTYIDENEVPAFDKNVYLTFKDGYLESFNDNWQLYTIGGTPEITKDEAVSLALGAVEEFSWQAYEADELIVVSDFEVVSVGEVGLSYLNFKDYDLPREGSQFVLFPSWYVPLGFDRTYPGSVTGAVVRVWADTGEVGSVDPMTAGGFPYPVVGDNENAEKGNVSNLTVFLIPLTVGVMLAVGVISVCIYCVKFRSKNKSPLSMTLFCLLFSFSLVFTAIPHTNAMTKISETYASDYGQLANDMTYANVVCSHITSTLGASGFNAYNNYYSTNLNTYYYNILWDQNYGDFTTVFHFGHMAGPNNLKLSDGNALTSTNVDEWVDSQYEFYFVWIWACMQANGPSTGMPPAWANYYGLISDDGYHNPDPYGPYCFIGFENMSPSIHAGSFNTSSCHAWVFINLT